MNKVENNNPDKLYSFVQSDALHLQHDIFQQDEIEQSVGRRFEKQVAKYPHNLAIKGRSRALTYLKLNQWVNQIARAILATSSDRKQPVIIFLEQALETLLTRNESLHTGFVSINVVPQQSITPISDFDLSITDLSSESTKEQGKSTNPLLERSLNSSFNLSYYNLFAPAKLNLLAKEVHILQ